MEWIKSLTNAEAASLGIFTAIVIVVLFVWLLVSIGFIKYPSHKGSEASENLGDSMNSPAVATKYRIPKEGATDVSMVISSAIDELPYEVSDKLQILVMAQYGGSLDQTISAIMTHLFTDDSQDHVLCLKKILEYAIAREGTDIIPQIRNFGLGIARCHGIDLYDTSKDISSKTVMDNPVTLLSVLIVLMNTSPFLHLAKKDGVTLTSNKETN